MDDVLRYWPVFVSLLGLVVWSLRLEALVKQNRESIKANQEMLTTFYATKTEVATLTGSVAGLSGQITDIKLGNQRIESKVDALILSKANSGSSSQRTGG